MIATRTIRALLLASSFATAAAFAQKNPIDDISSHDGLAKVTYDSETGAILARAIDRRESRNTGQWQLSSSVTNVGDAQQIAATWARILRDRLDKAKAAGKK